MSVNELWHRRILRSILDAFGHRALDVDPSPARRAYAYGAFPQLENTLNQRDQQVRQAIIPASDFSPIPLGINLWKNWPNIA